MDSMKITYVEEAKELLSGLEIALLALEQDQGNRSQIEAIFRVMHTLKGNSSMFGLPLVAEFVHDLETIYDKIRNNEIMISKQLLDCSFSCLDHLKAIIHDSALEVEANKINHESLLSQIALFAGNVVTNTNQGAADTGESKTYYIYFSPATGTFSNGTNPMFLISELATLGKCVVVPHFKVSGEDLNKPNECFTYWEVYLETKRGVNDIKDVFVFVEDNAVIELEELPFVGVITRQEFRDAVNRTIYNDEKIDLGELKKNFKTEKEIKPENKTSDHIAGSSGKETQDKQTKSQSAESPGKSVSSVRVSSDKLDELMNLVSELVTTQAALTLYTDKTKTSELETIAENVEKLSRRLRDVAFGMTLVPINNMFGRFQRMVRDVSANLGKEVDFITEGGETELDKSIIETLTDPLMHILRNSLDHGIEAPDVRVAKGKNKSGKLILKAFYSGAHVCIRITDDGKGINADTIRKKAISKGIIKQEDVLTENEIFELIFYPGFSTAEKVTDVSGRGVGMDVVKRNIADLKGSIKVESKVDEGTILTIRLPLTLSIIDGLLVMVNEVNYIIPLPVITKCYQIRNSDMLNNFNGLLFLDDEQVPFINVREQFGSRIDPDGNSQMIVVNGAGKKVGLSVDYIIGEYQAVVKSLGKHYKKQDFVSGASILGDGTIALVLDANKLIEKYIKQTKKEEKYDFQIQ